ncbi:MAG: hypothetical protein KBT12_06370 [Bacteroidales bacterium]|nr:hypothetical protein [Candidatus Physcousia equi]
MRRQSNWGTVLVLFLACGPAFEQSVANDLCFLPTVLPYIFSHAIIVSPDGARRPLLCQASDVSFPDEGMPVYLWLVGIVLLQAVLVMTHRVATLDPIRQTTDLLLLLFYTALSLLLPVVNVVTTQSSLKGWNWTFLFVNMLWATLWLYTKLRKNRPALRIDQAMSGSFMLFALVVFLVPSRFCLEQSIVCLIIALAAWQRSCYLRPYIHSVK